MKTITYQKNIAVRAAYDVAVVGSGPAGLCAAVAAARLLPSATSPALTANRQQSIKAVRRRLTIRNIPIPPDSVYVGEGCPYARIFAILFKNLFLPDVFIDNFT